MDIEDYFFYLQLKVHWIHLNLTETWLFIKIVLSHEQILRSFMPVPNIYQNWATKLKNEIKSFTDKNYNTTKSCIKKNLN